LCETTSVTWRFIQPFLKRFSRCPICVPNFFIFTFSRAVQRSTGNHEHAWKLCRTFKLWQITCFWVQHCTTVDSNTHVQGTYSRAAMVQEAPYRIIDYAYHRHLNLDFDAAWSCETAEVPWELFRGTTPYLTAPCGIGNF
jgi:hypothetical protein